jgi:hypothetical protein
VAADSVRQISDFRTKGQAAHDAAVALNKLGMRRQAIEIAKMIDDFRVRDQTLSELAQ